MKFSFLLFFVGLVCVSCGAPGLKPLKLPPPGADPNIFKTYDKKGDSVLAGGWSAGFDASGISFNDPRTVTLITPRHVVMAKHYQRAKETPVIFHDRKGKRIERFIIDRQNLSSDLTVGLLDRPVPENYTPYPIPDSSTPVKDLIGNPAFVTDQDRRVFIHLIASVSANGLGFKQDAEKRYGWGKNLIVGDSGNPSFVASKGRLVLIETHTFGGPGSGPNFADATLQKELNLAVKTLDPTYRVVTTKL